MAQHEVRKIDVPLVRRRVGAHGHEAHVAERAGVHDRLEAGGIDRIQLARFGFVNQVEQAREGIAEAEAAPAAVADVEDAARLLLQRCAVVEFGVSPVYRMAEGRALVGHRENCVTGTNRRAGCPAPRCRRGGRSAGSGAGSLAPQGDPAPQVRQRARSSPVRDPHSWRLHAAHPIWFVVEARATSFGASSLVKLSGERSVGPLYRITAPDLSQIFIPGPQITWSAGRRGYSAASVLPADVRKAGITASAKSRRLFIRFASP